MLLNCGKVRSRDRILKEVALKQGDKVFEFGCGTGSYTRIAADLVGAPGIVYALDIHPMAIQNVKEIAERFSLKNIVTICSDCATGLDRDSIDVILLYDVFHLLDKPDQVLTELHRVLKPQGVLSFSDHHMNDEKILKQISQNGLFRHVSRGKRTFSFAKVGKK